MSNSFENGVYSSLSGSNVIYREHTFKANSDREIQSPTAPKNEYKFVTKGERKFVYPWF